jgi:hypothetical protein
MLALYAVVVSAWMQAGPMSTTVDRSLNAMQTCARRGVSVILYGAGARISLRMRTDVEDSEAGFPRRASATLGYQVPTSGFLVDNPATSRKRVYED